MDELSFLSLVSPIISVYTLVRAELERRGKEEQELLRDFEQKFGEFVDDIMGWYNQIIDFASPIVKEVQSGGSLNAGQIREYGGLLERIRNRDEHMSKCRRFVQQTIPYFTERVKDPLKSALSGLKREYEEFEVAAFYSKDELGRLFEREGRGAGVETANDIAYALDNFRFWKDEIMKFRMSTGRRKFWRR